MRHALLLILLLVSASVHAAIHVVKPDGTGDFPTIQAAIHAAADGDIIELTDGVFSGDGNRDIDFLGKAITVGSQSGEAHYCVIDCAGTQDEPHRGFIFQSGEGSGSVLERVTVRNGVHERGGGVICRSASPTLQSCWFRSNHAFGSGPQDGGGGVYCDGGSAPGLGHCRFRENTAARGGGLLCVAASAPRLLMCKFYKNVATASGGGMSCLNDSSPFLKYCSLWENSTDGAGGGAYCGDDSAPLFEGTSFDENSAESGGGLASGGCASPVLSGCTFDRNSAVTGGGVLCNGCGPASTPEFLKCWFHVNNSEGDGGGLSCRGASPVIRGCEIAGNSSGGNGGAFHFSDCNPLVANCTLVSNSASLVGAGVYCDSGCDAVIANSIIAFSRTGSGLGCGGGQTLLSCCDIYGNSDGDWTECIEDQLGVAGNISLDPGLCIVSEYENWWDLGLYERSPCAPFSPPNTECDLIGAWGVGCMIWPTQPTTWGQIKARFRR